MITYKSGYKYQLKEGYSISINIKPGEIIQTEYICLSTGGDLFISRGYAWDGPSGPTIDTKSFMRGSLVHDALYQLIRVGLLGKGWREQADKELRRICLEDGMFRIRAWYIYRAVRRYAAQSAWPSSQKKIHYAP
jgi:hypothetical protein